MIASSKGYSDIVELLLNAGAKVNAKDKDGNTALVWALAKGHDDVVNLLQQAGAK